MKPDIRFFGLGLLLVAASAWLYIRPPAGDSFLTPPAATLPPLERPWPGEVKSWNHTYLVKGSFLMANDRDIDMNDFVYILVPRNTTHQRVRIVFIEPEPQVIEADENGNYYAKISARLGPNERTWINVTLEVEMESYEIDFNHEAARWPSLELVRRYTGPTMVWSTENETLMDLAEELVDGEENPLMMAEKIAEWVVDHVTYTIDPRPHRGADHCLFQVEGRLEIIGDCSEVADTYVTLCRVLGIPSRAAIGMMLETPSELYWLNQSSEGEGMELLTHWGGHIWPQIYVEPWGWIDVEMLEGRQPKVGDYSWRHIVYGIEEKNFAEHESAHFCASMYFDIEHLQFEFEPVEGDAG